MKSAPCRNCSSSVGTVFADLGMSPLANEYLAQDDLTRMQRFFPLKAYVCDKCLLVQLEDIQSPEAIFSDYAYLSSSSSSWLEHAQSYVERIIPALGLDHTTRVVELASNDGYLLQFFVQRGIPALGVEPAANVAKVAISKGVPTRTEFFGLRVATEIATEGRAKLVIANNVVAHVPDLHDFLEGVRIVLADDGLFTAEFPHLLNLISRLEFDTIYHEHFSYFSLRVIKDVLSQHGLSVVDVEELPTHGGSLRLHARPTEGVTAKTVTSRVQRILEQEQDQGLDDIDRYRTFEGTIRQAKRNLLRQLISYKEEGKTIAGYGAPAKAATLFNYCGIDVDILDFTTDTNPLKQGRYIPGTGIPIYHPQKIMDARPDLIWILPWNLKDEIMASLESISGWGGHFLVWDGELREVP